jgi:Xaa-Pro aminopeptidase
MSYIRKVKVDQEIDLIRKSVAMAEEAFNAIKGDIKAGESENHIAGLLVMELWSRGASGSSYPPIVAAGANSSLPHYRPGDTLVQQDQPLLLDWGALYKGYCSDLTRTLLVGRVSAKIKQIYKVVYEAQQAVIEFMRPGVTTMQADRVARDIIEKAGFGEQFGHGLGHGLGRRVHDGGGLSQRIEMTLEPGMVMTVEPGVYIPGWGGVRIEDDVVIRDGGAEILTHAPKELIEIA